jgi:two-component system nitrogen regulation response regulator NtrX
MQACDWPGNVRQLRNLVEWLLIMSPGSADQPIRADMLPPDLAAEAPPAANADQSGEIMAMSLREARETFERQYLTSQLVRFGGNISRTAEFVGMERSALHRKLKGLGIAEEGRTRPANHPAGDRPS